MSTQDAKKRYDNAIKHLENLNTTLAAKIKAAVTAFARTLSAVCTGI